jgi:hypothetical protein
MFLVGVSGRAERFLLLAIVGPLASLTLGIFLWSGREKGRHRGSGPRGDQG